jgi:hypothetical protein
LHLAIAARFIPGGYFFIDRMNASIINSLFDIAPNATAKPISPAHKCGQWACNTPQPMPNASALNKASFIASPFG